VDSWGELIYAVAGNFSRRRLGETGVGDLSGEGRDKMPGGFDDREDAFEKRFAHDEALRFRAVARRNKAIALWAAEQKELSPEAAETYANEFVAAQVGRPDGDVAVALRQDLARADIDISDHRLRKKMEEALAEAVAAIKSGA
jgi:hypothetical protein